MTVTCVGWEARDDVNCDVRDQGQHGIGKSCKRPAGSWSPLLLHVIVQSRTG